MPGEAKTHPPVSVNLHLVDLRGTSLLPEGADTILLMLFISPKTGYFDGLRKNAGYIQSPSFLS